MALNCLVFEKIAFLYTRFGDRHTDRQTNGQHHRIMASGGLIDAEKKIMYKLTNNVADARAW